MSVVKTHTLHDDEGVTTSQSQEGFHICLPPPASANHEIAIASVLWRLWVVARSNDLGTSLQWTIEVGKEGDMPLILNGIVAVIRTELSEAGGNLFVVYSSQGASAEID